MNLTREQLILLCRKSLENARSLIEEAELLFNNKHRARTVFLCHTAGEEFGKSVQCLTAIMDHARGVLDFLKFRKRFLNHRTKTKTIRFFEAMVTPDDDPKFLEEVKNLDNEVAVLTSGRNMTLYSDMFSDGAVFAPDDVVPEKMASDALSWAKGRLRMAETLIAPLLDSEVLKASDDELKKRYDGFMSMMSDPKKREELMAKLGPEEPLDAHRPYQKSV